MNTRALEQLVQMYERLQAKAKKLLPALNGDLGKLVSVDGSLIDTVPTIEFGDYRNGVKKAKAYLGSNLNLSIPECICRMALGSPNRAFFRRI
jgi:hypothetical protein